MNSHLLLIILIASFFTVAPGTTFANDTDIDFEDSSLQYSEENDQDDFQESSLEMSDSSDFGLDSELDSDLDDDLDSDFDNDLTAELEDESDSESDNELAKQGNSKENTDSSDQELAEQFNEDEEQEYQVSLPQKEVESAVDADLNAEFEDEYLINDGGYQSLAKMLGENDDLIVRRKVKLENQEVAVTTISIVADIETQPTAEKQRSIAQSSRHNWSRKSDGGFFRMRSDCNMRKKPKGVKLGVLREGKRVWTAPFNKKWFKVYRKSGVAFISKKCI